MRATLVAKAVVFSFAVLFDSSHAEAAVVRAVYGGMVYSSFDLTGLFGLGTGYGVADGRRATMTFTYDTSLGVRQTLSDMDSLSGGLMYGTVSPMISAVFKVNGIAFSTPGSTFSQIYNTVHPNGITFAAAAANDFFDDGVTSTYADMFANTFDYLGRIPLDIATPFSVAVENGDGKIGASSYDYASGTSAYSFGSYFKVDRLNVSLVSAVALPTGLPLLGTALAGLLLIARRRKAV